MKAFLNPVVLAAVLASLSAVAGCGEAESPKAPLAAKDARAVVVIETSLGTIKAELWADKAPVTVENFLRYTNEGFYAGTTFHRVIPTFMIQGGGFTADLKEKPTHEPIKNEASADVRNERGTLAMARTNEINSATSQFFINVTDNAMLDHRDNTANGFGYCVFGKVIEGLDVVDKIKAVATRQVGMMDDVPVAPVLIKSVTRPITIPQP